MVTIPLTAGGRIIVNEADREKNGLMYLAFDGTIPPDCDGVATLTEHDRRALVAALRGEGETDG